MRLPTPRSVLRVAPLLLCAAAPPTPKPDATINQLSSSLQAELGATISIDSALEERLRAVWQRSWDEQAAEIKGLTEITDADDESDTLDLRRLWESSDNSSSVDALTRARSVMRDLTRFWRYSTPRTDIIASLSENEREGFLEDAGIMGVGPGENITRDDALRRRRRQLERHAAAGTVEYRLFGDAIARDDALLDAIPQAGLVTLEGAWRQLGGLANISGWASDDEDEFKTVLGDDIKAEIEAIINNKTAGSSDPLTMELNEYDEQLRTKLRALDPDADVADVNDTEALMSRLTAAEIAAGTVGWRSWWVPKQIGDACEYAFYAGGAFADGGEAGGEACGAWMRLLAETIRRSTSSSFAAADDGLPTDTNAFPALLLLLSVVRQGHLEAVAVYTMARTLGTLNAKAISQYEGGGGSVTYPDEKVSVSEASNTQLAIAVEVYQLLEKELTPYLFGILFLSLVLTASVTILPLLLLSFAWYASSVGLGAGLDYLIDLGKPDPLDF